MFYFALVCIECAFKTTSISAGTIFSADDGGEIQRLLSLGAVRVATAEEVLVVNSRGTLLQLGETPAPVVPDNSNAVTTTATGNNKSANNKSANNKSADKVAADKAAADKAAADKAAADKAAADKAAADKAAADKAAAEEL